jgi:hypothetical protein
MAVAEEVKKDAPKQVLLTNVMIFEALPFLF